MQVRGDHAEVVKLLMQLGGKVRATSGALVDLQTTPLSRRAILHTSTFRKQCQVSGSRMESKANHMLSADAARKPP